MQVFLIIIILIEILITAMVSSHILEKAIGGSLMSPVRQIKCFVDGMFSNKNLFGFILSALILVLSIPAFVIIIMVQIIACISVACIMIWQLGDKS